MAALNNSVLVVDDEVTVRRLLCDVATKAGYEAFTAENGRQAVEVAREKKPSVIIMDIRMPEMDGLEAFKLIHRESPEIPVILMTAYGTVDIALQTIKHGAFDYLIKPSNINGLRSLLVRAIQLRSMHGPNK